jgi:hypothetical protein
MRSTCVTLKAGEVKMLVRAPRVRPLNDRWARVGIPVSRSLGRFHKTPIATPAGIPCRLRYASFHLEIAPAQLQFIGNQQRADKAPVFPTNRAPCFPPVLLKLSA